MALPARVLAAEEAEGLKVETRNQERGPLLVLLRKGRLAERAAPAERAALREEARRQLSDALRQNPNLAPEWSAVVSALQR